MKFKSFIFLLFFLIFGINLIWAQPKISLSVGPEAEYNSNLGELEEGRIYKRSFIISNLGDSELQIEKVTAPCGCMSIVYPKHIVVLAPNQSIEVKFTFNTEGLEGKNRRDIHIHSNDPQNPIIKLELFAEVKRLPFAAIRRFLSFGTLTVMGAGLIDGINPCAFTVLVFFISFLTFAGYKRKELLILGSTFILSVFICYVLIGLGLFKFIQSLEIFRLLSKIVYMTIAIMAIILGMYSLYDWYIYKKTNNPEEIKLRLPNFIKLKIQKIIQNSSRNRKRTMIDLVLAVFISGFFISLLESICTGQTYVPTIAYVLKTSYLRARAFIYLLLYNFMFILPLVAIFIAALLGVRSEAFSRLTRKYMGSVKLLMAALFFSLGILLLLVRSI